VNRCKRVDPFSMLAFPLFEDISRVVYLGLDVIHLLVTLTGTKDSCLLDLRTSTVSLKPTNGPEFVETVHWSMSSVRINHNLHNMVLRVMPSFAPMRATLSRLLYFRATILAPVRKVFRSPTIGHWRERGVFRTSITRSCLATSCSIVIALCEA
jgi:hypothetical protein